MAVLTPSPKMQFFTAAGVPLSGGKVYTYTAGTTTPQATYTDNTGVTPNANPIILDSRGEANIWLGAAIYKFRLTDANDVDIWTVDYISAPISTVSPVLVGNVSISSDTPTPALTITQVGAGAAIRVQDSSDPDATPFLVDATGNVGIGTAAPAQKLDVFDGLIRVGGSVQGKLLGYSSTNVYTMDLGVSVGTGAAADVGFFNRGIGNLVFGTNNTERVRIDSSGNVGVGTTSPDALLTVNTVASFGDGSASAPSVAHKGDLNTGLYFPAADTIGLTTSGTERARITSTGDLQFNSGYGSVATAYACRAWVNFNGTGTVAIRASGNVTSITDNGTGDYTVNMTNAMPDANYSYQVSVGYPGEPLRISLNTTGGAATEVAPTTSAFRFYTNNAANSAQVDPKYVNVAVFR